MRAIDGDALLKRVQQEKIQAQVHGRDFPTCFMNLGGTPSTEWWFVEDLIENSPTIEPEPCEDAVSRTELRHIFEEHCYPVHYDHNSVDVGMTLPGIVEVLNIAPSVAPKQRTGKWIDQKGGGCCCSECGRYALDEVDGNFIHVAAKSNYCPNCGSFNGGADVD